MALIQLSTLSRQYVRIPVNAPADPTGDVVKMAFKTSGIPSVGDWKTAQWATGGPPYVAECLVGPNGQVTLAAGTYDIWLQITDNPEIPVERVGVLLISDVAEPAAALATVDELASFMGQSVSDQSKAELILTLVTGAIRDWTGQTLTAVADDEIVLNGGGYPTILLPQVPVTAVSAVTQAGTALTEGTDYAWYPEGILQRLSAPWSVWSSTGAPQEIAVTYSHGYAVIPPGLKLIALRLAADLFNGAEEKVASETIGNYSVAYVDVQNAVLSVASALALYRVRSLV